MNFCGQPSIVSSGFVAQAVETVAINMSSGVAITFDISTGCSGVASGSFGVYLQYVDSATAPFPAAPSTALPLPACVSAATCSMIAPWSFFSPPGTFSVNGFNYNNAPQQVWFHSADYASGWTHINVSMPAANVVRRFRLVSILATGINGTWGVANVLATPLSSTCLGACGGRGVCQPDTSCACDAGFTFSGGTCVPSAALATVLREDFETPLLPASWATISGSAKVSTTTVVLGTASLYFSGGLTRRAVTAPLDTRAALYVQCSLNQYLSNAVENFMIAFSANNGASWTEIASSALLQASAATFGEYIVALPPAAQTPATSFMFWQPLYTSATQDTWVSPGLLPCVAVECNVVLMS